MGSGYLSLFLEALGLLGNQSGGRGGFAQKAGCRKSKATSIRSAHLNLLLANVWSSDDVVRNSRHLRQVMATCDFGMARGWMSTPLNYSGIIGVSLAACPCDPAELNNGSGSSVSPGCPAGGVPRKRALPSSSSHPSKKSPIAAVQKLWDEGRMPFRWIEPGLPATLQALRPKPSAAFPDSFQIDSSVDSEKRIGDGPAPSPLRPCYLCFALF